MSDDSPPPPSASQAPSARSEADPPRPAASARPRRPRLWLTVGEIVGVLALVVAGLSYLDSHRERVSAEKAHTAEERRAAAQRAFAITGEAQGGGDRLRLEPVNRDQPIQSQVFLFPKAVRGDPVQTAGQARVEADWFAHGLKKARERARMHESAGDERLPVGVVTTYLADGEPRADRAIYDIGYTAEHRFLGGTRIRLDGLSFVGRAAAGDLQARVDAIWRKRSGEGRTEPSPAAKPPEGPPD